MKEAIVMFCTMVLLASYGRAFADDAPQFCAADSNKTWYFSINSTIFEIENPMIGFRGLISVSQNPSVAKPKTKPLSTGCLNDPQKLNSIHFLSWPILANDARIPVPSPFFYIDIMRYISADNTDPKSDNELGELMGKIATCFNKHFISRLDDGTILCSNDDAAINPLSLPNQNAKYGYDWEYILSSNTYKTPLGEPFVAAYGENLVSVDYLLKRDLLVRYGWFVPNSMSAVTPVDLIKMDQVFRSLISNLSHN